MLNDNRSLRQWRKALIEEYPYLLPRDYTTDEVVENFDYEFVNGEYDLPAGWFELFLQCCEDIKQPLMTSGHLDKFRFIQIKEKYGCMRIYTNGVSNEIHNILAKYEFLSSKVCCVCGNPAAVQANDWISSYCFEHANNYVENKDNYTAIDTNVFYTQKVLSTGGLTDVTVDCSDEWKRYLIRIGFMQDYNHND